jgi:hypothetical protein
MGREKIDQGRAIAFDKFKGKIILIRDRKLDLRYPDYSQLPPVSYDLEKGFFETEPKITVGLRMKLDSANSQIIIYDPASQNFEAIKYTLLDKKERIALDNPLVFDADNQKLKSFPIVDRERKMITVYSRKQQILTTFTLPEKYFALPDYTWNAGDEVRVYYKEDGKAVRLVNITTFGFINE